MTQQLIRSIINTCSTHNPIMNANNLLEMARLRSIVQRLRRTQGNDQTLVILQRVIEMEFSREESNGKTPQPTR